MIQSTVMKDSFEMRPCFLWHSRLTNETNVKSPLLASYVSQTQPLYKRRNNIVLPWFCGLGLLQILYSLFLFLYSLDIYEGCFILVVKVLPCEPALDNADRFLAAVIDCLHSWWRHDLTTCIKLLSEWKVREPPNGVQIGNTGCRKTRRPGAFVLLERFWSF